MRSEACMMPRGNIVGSNDFCHWAESHEPCLLLGELVLAAAGRLHAFQPFAFAS